MIWLGERSAVAHYLSRETRLRLIDSGLRCFVTDFSMKFANKIANIFYNMVYLD